MTKLKLGLFGAACAAIIMLTGCHCCKPKARFTPCANNVEAHMPVIICQPLDANAMPGERAVYSTEAMGKNLTYLWYSMTRGKAQFEPIPGATGPRLEIHQVNASDYGTYFCAIGSDGEDGTTVVQTRCATLGGNALKGAGGDFVPCQNPVASGTTTTICGNSVSGVYDRFPTNEIPPTGTTWVVCSLVNTSANPPVTIPNTDYYLQYWVTAPNSGCCTNYTCNADSTACVAHAVTAGLTYKFTAWFVPAYTVTNGTIFQLQGTWMQ